MDDTKLRELFDSIDVDKNGSISVAEAKGILQKMGLPVTNRQVAEFLKKVDVNRDNVIDWEEFYGFVKERRITMRGLFDAIDTDKSGFIDPQEVFLALRGQGLVVDPEATSEILRKIDTNKDGKISFEEFEEFLCGLPILNSKELCNVLRGHVNIDNGDGVSSAPYFPTFDGARRPLGQIFANVFSAAAARSVTSPLERVKLMFQTSSTNDTKKTIGLENVAQYI